MNGLIKQEFCFGPECCFSNPVPYSCLHNHAILSLLWHEYFGFRTFISIAASQQAYNTALPEAGPSQPLRCRRLPLPRPGGQRAHPRLRRWPLPESSWPWHQRHSLVGGRLLCRCCPESSAPDLTAGAVCFKLAASTGEAAAADVCFARPSTLEAPACSGHVPRTRRRRRCGRLLRSCPAGGTSRGHVPRAHRDRGTAVPAVPDQLQVVDREAVQLYIC